MEEPENKLLDIVDVVKSWILRRSEPTYLSRDFWMPDNSCRVCYDCDSQFTIFNRRHHCRVCGRVFCSKCTANSIPALCDNPGREELDKIRVCNYCHKQWMQDLATGINGTELTSPGLSPSSSLTSLASIKSSVTTNSLSTVGSSVPYTAGIYEHVQQIYNVTSGEYINAGVQSKKQDMTAFEKKEVSADDTGEPLSDHNGFGLNRSDDECDEYGSYCSDSGTKLFQPSEGCCNTNQLIDLKSGFASCVAQPREQSVCSDGLEPALGLVYPTSGSSQKLEEDSGGLDVGEECDAPSMYKLENYESEPVDFENNGLLWLPPEPEDGEDEKEAFLLDNDDEDSTGEWKQFRASSSFGSGEDRNRDRTSEEHRTAMKNVVEGHFRALVAQLLQVENLSAGEEEGQENWLDIVTSLSWEAATLLKPDTSKGGGMDPGGYVKVKCIACGVRSESEVVKGVVCKKNVAHRRMNSKLRNARILILGGALEYQRVSNLLSSVDTLLQQEMDHLKMAVAKIASHHPNILLVEKSVSRFAQEYLLTKEISLVLNIKRPVLERIARCTGAQIVQSVDQLSSQKLGFCEFFHVEKYVEEYGSAGQDGKKLLKTLMLFEGCPKPLAFTILLKGGSGDELKKVKHVIQYGIFAAYHLALETSFLADEGASLPELPLKSPIAVALPVKPLSVDRSISVVPGFVSPAASKAVVESNFQSARESLEQRLPFNGLYGSTNDHISKCPILGSSPNVDISSCNGIQHLASEEVITEPHLDQALDVAYSFLVPPNGLTKSGSAEQIADVNQEIANAHPSIGKATDAGQIMSIHKNNPQQQSMVDLPQDSQGKNGPAKEEFPPSPSDHQSILVSLSTRCVWKGTVCEKAHLFRIKYYGNFDKPLGRFLRDHLFDQSFKCRSCDMPTEAHVHCYTHRQGSLTISVKKLSEFVLPGESEGKIWMWHRCLRCPRSNGFPPATRRIVMSDAAWGLSFGKFLELSFSNHAAASRVASCGHSLHRDCLRFYGFGNMVACFSYASIDVHSVYLPPPKLDFSYEHQDWVQKEVNEVEEMAKSFFNEVLNHLQQIGEKLSSSPVNGATEALTTDKHIQELKSLHSKEKAEFEDSLQWVFSKELKKGNPFVDVLDINWLRRQLICHSYVWDKLLISAASIHHGHTEALSHSVKSDAQHGSIETAAEAYLGTHTKTSTSRDASLNSLSDSEIPKGMSCSSESQEENCDPRDCVGETHHDHVGDLESGGQVRRSLSEGQFPLLANLSDTLDAAWTGETSSVVTPMENGLTPSESALPVSTSPIKSAISMPEAGVFFSSEINKQTEIPVLTIPIKELGQLEGCSSWMGEPLSTLYHPFSKSSGSSSPKLDFLIDYSPVYVLSFRELDQRGGARLHLSPGIKETIIPVYDDEPTSVISYALSSPDYCFQMMDEKERSNSTDSLLPILSHESNLQPTDEVMRDSLNSSGSVEDGSLTLMGSQNSLVLDPLLYTKALHVRVCFGDDGPPGKVKYTVICYFAKRFEALRKICCPSELDFIRSLSRCRKWGAQGGKSNVFFAKTLDDRFIIKQVTKTELESFIKFAPEYFKYLSESIGSGSPTCLAKILGIYQVIIKHLKGGKESRMDVLVMENLLFRRSITRLYDLKGSSRSRYNPDSGGSNKVLLDQNLIESMPTSPIFVGNKAKRLLERAVWNDTSFLASIDVMDYSLLVGVDEERHELVLGIIDFMRQYTWDKHLETWVKASGILGGLKNTSPTVISPKQYKKRFRKAMSAYFLMVPDQWSPPSIVPSGSQSDFNNEEYLQIGC